MATAATSLLGLALPVTGELSGTWGDTVNVSITALLDTAVAGTTTLSSDADVTLTTTTLAANQARQAIILWTAGGTVTRTITAPAQSKSYIVINKTSSSQSIKIVGVGPTTGVTIVAGTAAFVVWNGVDFVTASVTSTTGILPVANGGTGLASGTSGGVLAYTATGTLASSTALAASALVLGGGAGAAPATTTTGTGVVTALGVNTASAGAFVVNGGVLGTPSSGTFTNATGLPISTGVSGLGTGIATALAVNVGTAGSPVVNGGALGSPSTAGTMPAFTLAGTVAGGGNQINNVIIGASTPLAGSFTTLSATGAATVGAGLAVTGAISATGVLNLSGVNQIHQLSGHNFLQGDATRTYLYGGTSGIQMRTSNNATALFEMTDAGQFSFSPAGTTTAVVSSTGLAVTGAISATGDATINSLTVGRGAGAVSTNTAVGSSALAANTTGSQNVAVGSAALVNSGAVIGNTAVGFQAAGNSQANYNTAIGWNALVATNSGANNTALGTQALQANTTASNNTAVGYQAGYSNTTGIRNTAIGRLAGYSNQTSSDNVALGSTALYSNTGGSNVAIGSDALQANTTASNNTAVGYQAGYSNTTGTSNTFIGYSAGRASTIAAETTAVGYHSLLVNTGNSNTAFGERSMLGNTTGTLNTALGSYALAVNTTGSRNVAAGREALSGVTTGNNNTAIGPTTSGSLITTGSNNTIIGNYSGNQGGLDIRTASNYIVLSDGDGNPLISTNSTRSVALNGAVPQTGTGITFPATQVASADVNTLDDYEEGTWTPTLTTTGTDFTSVTYAAQTGEYVKIGNVIHYYFSVATSAVVIGTASGDVGIGGLPFAVGGGETTSYLSATGWTLNIPSSAEKRGGSQTFARLKYRATANGATADMAVANVSTGANTVLGCLTIVRST